MNNKENIISIVISFVLLTIFLCIAYQIGRLSVLSDCFYGPICPVDDMREKWKELIFPTE